MRIGAATHAQFMPTPCTMWAAGTRQRRSSARPRKYRPSSNPGSRCCIRFVASYIATCSSPPPSAPPGGHANAALLDIALIHLTLGRAALCAAVLEGSGLDQVDPCRETLRQTVDGLRRSGMQNHLPLGLLTRAWLGCLTGARTGSESAQTDLNEA